MPSTILSRCQRFDLRAISIKELVDASPASPPPRRSRSTRRPVSPSPATRREHAGRREHPRPARLVRRGDGHRGEGDRDARDGARVGAARHHRRLIAGDCRRGLELIDDRVGGQGAHPLSRTGSATCGRSCSPIRSAGTNTRRASRPSRGRRSRITGNGSRSTGYSTCSTCSQRRRGGCGSLALVGLAFLKARARGNSPRWGNCWRRSASSRERLGGRTAAPPRAAAADGPAAGAVRGDPAAVHRQPGGGKEGTAGSPHRVPPQEAVSHPARPRGARSRVCPAREAAERRPAHDAPGAEQGRPRGRCCDEVGGAAGARAGSWHDVLDRVGMVRPMLKSCLIEGTPVAFEDGSTSGSSFPRSAPTSATRWSTPAARGS